MFGGIPIYQTWKKSVANKGNEKRKGNEKPQIWFFNINSCEFHSGLKGSAIKT